MSDTVVLKVEGHVATVTLNRPDTHNAINLEMFEALSDVGEQLKSLRSVRSVVLQGAGENFCAGIDTSIFQKSGFAVDSQAMAPGASSPANFFQRAAYVWREIPMPVICAITGVAYGGGLQIALGADLRYACPDARMSVMEVKWGLIPDMAISTTLRDILAVDRIKELAWSGRVVTGDEALQLGLVTALHDDPRAAAKQTALAISEKSPDAIQAMKRLFNSAWQLSDAKALALEAELQLSVIGKENQLEAAMANSQNREPEFSDPGG